MSLEDNRKGNLTFSALAQMKNLVWDCAIVQSCIGANSGSFLSRVGSHRVSSHTSDGGLRPTGTSGNHGSGRCPSVPFSGICLAFCYIQDLYTSYLTKGPTTFLRSLFRLRRRSMTIAEILDLPDLDCALPMSGLYTTGRGTSRSRYSLKFCGPTWLACCRSNSSMKVVVVDQARSDTTPGSHTCGPKADLILQALAIKGRNSHRQKVFGSSSLTMAIVIFICFPASG